MAVLALACAAVPAQAQRYGSVAFPQDEHMHQDGFDYWWGAAHVTTTAGHRYAVSAAFDNFAGYGASAGDVFPLDGPYKGRSLLTEEGPAEWGHGEQPAGRYLSTMSRYLP